MKQYKVKPKHDLLAPEKWVIDEFYSFTVNLADEYTDFAQTFMAYNYFIYKYFCPYVEVDYFFEISSLGRLHVHGVLMVPMSANLGQVIAMYWALKSVRDVSSIEIDTIKDFDTWLTYMGKQYGMMKLYTDLPVRVDSKLLTRNKDIRKPQHLRDIISEAIDYPGLDTSADPLGG